MICFRLSEISPRVPTGITMVSSRSDCPNRGEERKRIERMMSIRCFNWVPIGELVEPNIYHYLGVDYKKVGFYLEVL